MLNKGYIILFCNWRSGKKEIDIIALKGDILVMTEIKTRTSTYVGYPEDAVTRTKRAHLKAAGDDFLNGHPQYRHMRFDIISVVMEGDTAKEIVHFEEAFY